MPKLLRAYMPRREAENLVEVVEDCLLYTSDAADE